MSRLHPPMPMLKNNKEELQSTDGETVLEINRKALAKNFHYLKSKLASTTKFMAVVKANSYGSDANVVAEELEKLGVDYFAVAYSGEGEILYRSGISKPIVVLHTLLANFQTIVENKLEPSIYSEKTLRDFIRFARETQLSEYPIHIKINTGLNRLGFEPEQIVEIGKIISEAPELKVSSIFSHLVASEDDKERDFTLKQIETFTTSANKLISKIGYRPLLHCTNTSAIDRYPQAHFDMVRSGMGLYGYTYDPEENKHLEPVATLKTVISQIHHLSAGESVGYNRGFIAEKPIVTATIAVGHADGIPRSLGKGKGWVLIQGRKAPIIGNVCMDMIMVNITGISCKEGDEVIVFGKENPVDKLAIAGDTIAYELLTGISLRIRRKIIDD